ncbi:HSF-type DNA-binding-domain-containing protein [Truncatella angustata]|uniref:HSF-type DNA-binding-domain-containing protein n=1 Tax=Truncatella angustata TaxID=152316 RepID=A0A9P8UT28_9PEZI|nr:HSF-type DNA-binding-domain-containing protein [Truncatella angustata]KAH6657676.1 HSF-type DNA-binding-domain-containing protein [Truncatella angustata]
MATVIESASRTHLGNDSAQDMMGARTIPIITSTTPTPTIKTSAPSPRGDPMDLTTPTDSSVPGSSSKSPEDGANDHSNASSSDHQLGSNSAAMPAPAIAAAAVHQPKIVQTAFIHKLYNMLEDPNIQHLISWSQSNESFVMSPSQDFAKVLAQYFKHTNVSSFVRQLNMYGFHKVSDVFHTGSPETVLWEFKHGNGNFKRGDLVGLREIKRRASRHSLVHREYNNSKPTPSQPGTPSEPMPPIPDGADPRVVGIEHTLYEITQRLQRSEENAHYMHIKQQAMMDSVTRLLEFNQSLSRTFLSLVPNPNEPLHQDVLKLQGEIQRQTDIFRSLDEPHEPPLSSSRQFFANIDNAPLSPRQLAQDDQRRPNTLQARGTNFYRPPVPSNLSIGSRRPYGSISGAAPLVTNQSSPSPLRPQPPPVPPGPHPLSNVEGPGSMVRRHTSADIRAHEWQAAPNPFTGSGQSSSQWPSSPNRLPNDDRGPRDSLSAYPPHAHSLSRPSTPPPPPPFSNGISNMDSFNNWSWGSAGRENKNLSVKDNSLPPTRRGSMAHILNPSDTAEHENEDDGRGDDDRKRKRML